MIAGSETVACLYRDGRRMIVWALGGGMTGRPNTIARFLPEAPEAGGASQVAVEMIDWLQPEGEERGARAIYACSHPVLRRWMHHGLRWLLEGGEMPGMTPLPHVNVQLVHRMEPPAVTPPDYINVYP